LFVAGCALDLPIYRKSRDLLDLLDKNRGMKEEEQTREEEGGAGKRNERR
jgi:hypothetical protein